MEFDKSKVFTVFNVDEVKIRKFWGVRENDR